MATKKPEEEPKPQEPEKEPKVETEPEPEEEPEPEPEEEEPEVVPTVVFMIGRMNPPTPGHVKLAEEVLKIAREKEGIARIYLTTSLNPPDIAPRIEYVTNDPSNVLSRKRRSDGDVSKEPLYVKHPKAQNPLHVDLKKRFLIDMLVHRKQGTDVEKRQFKDDLDKIVVTNCARRGPMSAMWCAAMEQLGWPSQEEFDQNNIDPSKLIYVMGGEVNAEEAANREKNCANEENGPAIWEKNPRLSCVIVQRTEEGAAADEDQEEGAAAADEDQEEGAAAAEEEEEGEAGDAVNLESMSGSKVRLLVGCEPRNREQARVTFDRVYENYLSPDQRNDLYDAINNGLFGVTECPKPSSSTNKRSKPQGAGTKKRRRSKARKTLKKKKHGKKKIGSKKGKRKTKRLRKGKKLLKPGVRKRHSTRRKR